MIPSFSPICAAAITKESVDVNKMALPSTILRGYHFRKTSDGNSFEIKSPTIKIGIISILEGSLKIDQTSKFTPTITKKIGMKKPYPIESSFQPYLHLVIIMIRVHLLRRHLKYFRLQRIQITQLILR